MIAVNETDIFGQYSIILRFYKHSHTFSSNDNDFQGRGKARLRMIKARPKAARAVPRVNITVLLLFQVVG